VISRKVLLETEKNAVRIAEFVKKWASRKIVPRIWHPRESYIVKRKISASGPSLGPQVYQRSANRRATGRL